MDLCERKNDLRIRHPWELSRLNALKSLLRIIPGIKNNMRVLDVGCGDGFLSRKLFKDIKVKSITGIDTHLSDQQAAELSMGENGIILCNNYDKLKNNYYDFTLLLDIIEHVEDDKSFLSDIVDKYMAADGYILITAPAFQSLYSSHDRFLKHYRRYNCRELRRLVNATTLGCLSSGYLFLSLLPIRYFFSCYERLTRASLVPNRGVGAWNHGKIITKGIELMLRGDIRFSLTLNRLGFKLPGLTVWVLCKKLR